MDAPLQPLRVPNGWLMLWNTFFEEEPSTPENAKGYYFGGADLLSAVHPARGISIDLEWKTERTNPEAGCYYFKVLRATNFTVNKTDSRKSMFDCECDWEAPIHTYETTSRLEVVAEIEHWLMWHCPPNKR